MEMIRHHLTEPVLMAYSAGTLPEAFAIVVASHVSLCDECRARLAAFDALGGAVLDSCEGVKMEPSALERTLNSIHESPKPPIPAPRIGGRLPAPLRDYVGGDIDAIRWRAVGGGVRQMVLKTEKSATARLLFIPPGEAVPDHTHGGTELTMVLTGSFHDEIDRFEPGDVETADEKVQHQPVAEEGEPCICLAATDARLRFRSLIPRLLGPIIGI